MRYLMVKLQLYLQKLLTQAFEVSVQITIGISRLKRYISKQITIQLGVIDMLLSKKKTSTSKCWLSNQRFGNYLGSYPYKLH